MAEKEIFIVHDNPTMVFESRIPDPYRFQDPDGTPGNPSKAEMRIFDATGGVMLKEGDVEVFDDTTEYITIEPANEAQDRGALIYVKYPPTMMDTPGRYTIYLSTIFDDGLKVTDNYRVDVAEYK